MFNLLNPEPASSKCYISTGNFPRFIDPNQPPTKKKPFSTIMNQPFDHTIDLILPEEVYELIWKGLEAKLPPLHYSRVIMPLSALLEGEFFNYYIKIGNIAMLSEGRPGIDDTYSLKDGTLRLLLSKEVYERTGLLGKPIRDTGRKHLKTRYEVELNLRTPSMLHGKKGFERLVWASKNILTRSLTWLFHDFHSPNPNQTSPPPPPAAAETKPSPLAAHHPFNHTVTPLPTILKDIQIPTLNPSAQDDDAALSLHEYLSLITLHSPRLSAADAIDPLLSRYEAPDAANMQAGNVVHVRWRGFIPAVWVRGMVVELSKMQKIFDERKGWWAMSAYAFEMEPAGGREGWTVLRLASSTEGEEEGEGERGGGGYVLWEVER